MKRVFVVINGITELTNFIRIAIESSEAPVICERGAYKVDGKNWTDLVSLDPSYGMIVEYSEAAAALDEYLKPFIKDYVELGD